MWTEVSSLDLTTVAPRLQMPVFFFFGRHDHVIVAETSAAYFDVLAAPSKRLLWFEDSAHEPPFEDIAGTIRRIILPKVNENGMEPPTR